MPCRPVRSLATAQAHVSNSSAQRSAITSCSRMACAANVADAAVPSRLAKATRARRRPPACRLTVRPRFCAQVILSRQSSLTVVPLVVSTERQIFLSVLSGKSYGGGSHILIKGGRNCGQSTPATRKPVRACTAAALHPGQRSGWHTRLGVGAAWGGGDES